MFKPGWQKILKHKLFLVGDKNGSDLMAVPSLLLFEKDKIRVKIKRSTATSVFRCVIWCLNYFFSYYLSYLIDTLAAWSRPKIMLISDQQKLSMQEMYYTKQLCGKLSCRVTNKAHMPLLLCLYTLKTEVIMHTLPRELKDRSAFSLCLTFPFCCPVESIV